MQISSRYTLAIHIMICIHTFENQYKITSDFLSSSTQTNPVIIRNILSQLKKAELIQVKRGSGGASIAKPLDEISLFDIYKAVECIENNELFHFHENPNPQCPVGKNIHHVLDKRLKKIQKAMEETMASMTLQSIINDNDRLIKHQK